MVPTTNDRCFFLALDRCPFGLASRPRCAAAAADLSAEHPCRLPVFPVHSSLQPGPPGADKPSKTAKYISHATKVIGTAHGGATPGPKQDSTYIAFDKFEGKLVSAVLYSLSIRLRPNALLHYTSSER